MLKKLLLLSLALPLISAYPIHKAEAEPPVENPNQTYQVEARELDKRAIVLQSYLEQYNSPLASHSQDFIDAADSNGVDWKLVPAISGVESTFGKRIPGGYNGWGWGVYGSQALGFGSWRDGIFTVNKGLKEKYIDKGLNDPYEMNTIYAASPTWGVRVDYFMQDIEKYANSHDPELDQQLPVKYSKLDNKTVETSAKLVFFNIGPSDSN